MFTEIESRPSRTIDRTRSVTSRRCRPAPYVALTMLSAPEPTSTLGLALILPPPTPPLPPQPPFHLSRPQFPPAQPVNKDPSTVLPSVYSNIRSRPLRSRA